MTGRAIQGNIQFDGGSIGGRWRSNLSDHLALNVRLLLRELIIAMAITKMPYCRAIRPHIALLLTNQIAIRPLVIK